MNENLSTELAKALAVRKAKLAECPVRAKTFHAGACPKCHATTKGPCWINVEADAAFVDAAKELLAARTGQTG